MMLVPRARRWVAAATAAVLAAAVVAGCASLDEWQRQTIFNPARDNPRWFTDPLPGTEEYDVRLANGDTLHFWYLAQARATAAPTVLYLHGARWNMNGSVFRISRFRELGFNVLAVDYRGFGRSTEILPSEQSAAEDTRAAFDELARRQPDWRQRYIYAHSLGGAHAIELASDLAPEQLRGVIIDSTFTSIPDLVRDLSARGQSAREAASIDDIISTIVREHTAGDLVVLMSNGGFGGIHGRLLQALK